MIYYVVNEQARPRRWQRAFPTRKCTRIPGRNTMKRLSERSIYQSLLNSRRARFIIFSGLRESSGKWKCRKCCHQSLPGRKLSSQDYYRSGKQVCGGWGNWSSLSMKFPLHWYKLLIKRSVSALCTILVIFSERGKCVYGYECFPRQRNALIINHETKPKTMSRTCWVCGRLSQLVCAIDTRAISLSLSIFICE